MNFKTHNDKEGIDSGSAGLLFYIETDLKTLTSIFGKPLRGKYDPSKIRVFWEIEFEDGIACDIYDWKQDHSKTTFHVGGEEKNAENIAFKLTELELINESDLIDELEIKL